MKKTTEKTIAKIDASKDYSLSEIVKGGLMGTGKSYFVCKTIINEERWQPESERLLKAEKRGNSVGTVYYIKGQNLINFLIKADN